MELYVTTVNNSFQSLPIFCHKEIHLAGYIGHDLNILKWSTRILKDIGGDQVHPSENTHIPRCPKNLFPEVLRSRFFTFNIKWTEWS